MVHERGALTDCLVSSAFGDLASLYIATVVDDVFT